MPQLRMVRACTLWFLLIMIFCCIVNSNSIGIKGAEALASYLMQKNQLQSLMLSSNRICDDGAVAIALVRKKMCACVRGMCYNVFV
jgi:hypothetical protein